MSFMGVNYVQSVHQAHSVKNEDLLDVASIGGHDSPRHTFIHQPQWYPSPVDTVGQMTVSVQSNEPKDRPVQERTSENVRSDTNRSNTSFMSNVFRGEIEPLQVFPYPEQTDEQKDLIHTVMDPVYRFLRQEHDPLEAERNGELNPATLDEMWKMGLLGMLAPEEYGGLGMSNTTYANLGDIVGEIDLGLGTIIGAHQSIGYKGISMYGTDEQKRKYLPHVTSGGKFSAFALTEPGTGSDVSAVKTRAVKSACGKYYTLNGSKLWITGGGIAEVYTVFAKTEVFDPKLEKMKDKITAFIVERGFPGVSTGPPENKMGITISNTAEVYFDDVKVPIENVLGKEGDGFKIAVTILNNGRFGMAGTMAGTMRICIQKAVEHVNGRVQFGRKLREFGNVQEKLARMAMYQYVTQSMAFMVAGNMDAGYQDYLLETTISKIFSSESAFTVCDEAIQILGGNGFMKSTGLEKFLRDIRIFRIFEGANDVLRMFVALTGIQYAGSHLKEVQRALRNPIGNLGMIFEEGSRRAARTIGVKYGNDMSEYVAAPLKGSAKICADSADMLAIAVESALVKHGKAIVDKQFILKRFADSAIDIYAMACALSRASRAIEKDLPSAEHELLMTTAWCIEASERVRLNIRQVNSGDFVPYCDMMSQIATNVCNNGGVVQQLPLELNLHR